MSMREFWLEILADLGSMEVLLQLAVLLGSLASAWVLNRVLLVRLLHNTPESWKVGMGGIARVLFPMLALFMVNIGQAVLRHAGYHTSALRLAATLLMAMAAIRLAVYALRYIFAPSGWLRTTEGFIVGFTWGMVALHLTGLLPEVTTFLDELSFSVGQRKFSVLLLMQSVLIAAITLIMTLWAGRVLENRLMRTEQMDMNLRVVLSKLLRVALILVGVLSALSVVGFDITVLSVFGGALGVGLGFGLQKIASNYISGFIILLDHSIHLGDVLTVDTHYGVVSQLRARYVVLRKLDGTEVVIPNDTLITSTVINHSYSDRRMLVKIPVQISYDSGLDTAMHIMREAAASHPRVIADPPPKVLVTGFGDNGINLQISCWVNDPEEGFAMLQSEIYMAVWRAFQDAGISIPFPQREVRMLK